MGSNCAPRRGEAELCWLSADSLAWVVGHPPFLRTGVSNKKLLFAQSAGWHSAGEAKAQAHQRWIGTRTRRKPPSGSLSHRSHSAGRRYPSQCCCVCTRHCPCACDTARDTVLMRLLDTIRLHGPLPSPGPLGCGQRFPPTAIRQHAAACGAALGQVPCPLGCGRTLPPHRMDRHLDHCLTAAALRQAGLS